LALKGQVIPSTLEDVTLVAHYTDGSIVSGEVQIPKARKKIDKVGLSPDRQMATPDAIKAIKEAQIIVLGPGSLYTSIIPNLLVEEISKEIAESEAIKVYVCNVMTQPGETDGYSACDHVKALVKHSSEHILDYCIVNNGEVPEGVLKRYAGENSLLVANDRKNIENLGYRFIEEDFIMIQDGVIRHDADKLAKIVLSFIEEF